MLATLNYILPLGVPQKPKAHLNWLRFAGLINYLWIKKLDQKNKRGLPNYYPDGVKKPGGVEVSSIAGFLPWPVRN